jgi:hypothetical protein
MASHLVCYVQAAATPGVADPRTARSAPSAAFTAGILDAPRFLDNPHAKVSTTTPVGELAVCIAGQCTKGKALFEKERIARLGAIRR